MKDQKPTYLNLPDRVGRMARMAAAKMGVSLSEYVTGLVIRDAQETGIADLVDVESNPEGKSDSNKGGK